MATYYLSESGSDANAGTSFSNAFKTPNALPTLNNGDAVYVEGRIRDSTTMTGCATGGPALLSVTSKSGVQILQRPGGERAVFCGDRELNKSGWTASTNAWQLTIGTGLTMDAVVYKWRANVDQYGRNYGHLVPDTLANCQNATGAIGRYNYVSGTGVMTVYLGGDNPNTSGYPVAICVIGSNHAIAFNGGTRNSVDGVNFELYPSTGNFGWSVIFSASTNGSVSNSTTKDPGNHGYGAYGATGDASGCSFNNCQVNGIEVGGTSFVWYQASATGNLTGCRANKCSAHVYRYLGTDGNPRSGLATTEKVGYAAHSDGGTVIRDVQIENSFYREYEAGDRMASALYVPTPSDKSSWSSYAFRLDQCTQVNAATAGHLNYIAFRRCQLDWAQAGPSGVNGLGGNGWLNIQSGATVLLEACAVTVDQTSGAFVKPILAIDAGSGFYFTNCSFYDKSSTASQYWMLGNYVASQFHVKGCAFSSATAKALMANDTDAGFVCDFSDNLYQNISSYSEVTSRDTQAEWLATVDTFARFTSSSLFVASVPVYPIAGGILQSWTRQTGSSVIEAGVDAYSYRGYYGAHQSPFHTTGASRQ